MKRQTPLASTSAKKNVVERSMKFIPLLSVAIVGFDIAFVATPSAHASFLINGDFSSGLTGWTPYTTSNCTIGTPAVVNFDVTGLGSSPAAQLLVGEVNFTGQQEGGGLLQAFSGPEGDYSFSYDFASEAPSSGNLSGGLFSLIFNGVVLDSLDTEFIDSGSIERGSLNGFLAGVPAGTHEVRIQATRPFLTASSTPFQYFDNVVVNVDDEGPNTSTSVPGPLPLLGVGAALGFSRKLRRRIKGSTPAA